MMHLLALLVLAGVQPVYASAPLPKGLMLNLDLQHIEGGLIPNKTLYPLYVPMGELGTETFYQRKLLTFRQGQGLDIPHSALLDPDGSEWIITVRVFALTDGIILSQGDEEKGYAIYMKDGVIHAAIRTNHASITLSELPENGITDYLKEWVTIELKIKPDMAVLSLNRNRAALVPLDLPLSGKNHKIRLGAHPDLPAALNHNTTATPTGFTGAVSSLKLLRQ
jgi:hypothetical protein